jgi:hypothetical protein
LITTFSGFIKAREKDELIGENREKTEGENREKTEGKNRGNRAKRRKKNTGNKGNWTETQRKGIEAELCPVIHHASFS